MASNDQLLKRLLELGALHTDADARNEQKDLVTRLASNIDVHLDEEEVHQKQEETHEEPAREASPEPTPEPESHHHHTSEHEHHHHEEHEHHHHQEAAPEPEPEPAPKPQASVSSARGKFEQPQENKAQKVERKPAVQRKSMPPPRRDSNPAPVGGNECDLSDPKITEAYEDVRDDNTDANWILLGYGNSKKELKLYGSGSGGLEEFVSTLPDAEVVYGYLRIKYGDSARSKFVFVTYVPESLSGLAKAKANMHKPSIDRFLKYFHVQVAATSLSDLQESTIQAKLTAAAGANYGTGGVAPAGSEKFGNIKNNAKSFFQETEKRGSVQIKYNTDPLSRETPVSLNGRAGITEKYIST